MSTTEQRQTDTLPAGTWNADPVHSEVGFSVQYMAGTFRGTFSTFQVQVENGVLSGAADVASIQVKDPNLEAHLQSPEFFDAERYPKLTFTSRELTRDGERLTIKGEITIKGHTEAVEISGTISEPIADPYGNTRFGLTLHTTVDRTDFDIRWNNPLPSGDIALANEVTIDAELQLVQAAA